MLLKTAILMSASLASPDPASYHDLCLKEPFTTCESTRTGGTTVLQSATDYSHTVAVFMHMRPLPTVELAATEPVEYEICPRGYREFWGGCIRWEPVTVRRTDGDDDRDGPAEREVAERPSEGPDRPSRPSRPSRPAPEPSEPSEPDCL